MRLLISLILIMPMLASCGAKFNSIHRTFRESVEVDTNGDALRPTVRGQLVDAKQRAILSSATKKTTTRNGVSSVETLLRTCAEPSPDVFTVLSSSLSASGTFTGAANKNATAQLATALSEAGANIGLRTQTIQVLRDVMYRTCERYMNGAIGDEEFQIQAARDQRIIVSILAIEQLTGAVRNAPMAISATAKADTGASLLEAQRNVEATEKTLATKKKAAKAAGEALEEKKVKETAAKKAFEGPPENAAKKPAYETAQGETATAKKAKEKADEEVKTQEKILASLKAKRDASMGVSAGGSSQIFLAKGFETKPIDAAVAGSVADAVKEIVAMTFEVDEVVLKCIKLMGSNQGGTADTEFCQGYLNAVNARDRLKVREKASELGIKNEELDAFMNDSFE